MQTQVASVQVRLQRIRDVAKAMGLLGRSDIEEEPVDTLRRHCRRLFTDPKPAAPQFRAQLIEMRRVLVERILQLRQEYNAALKEAESLRAEAFRRDTHEAFWAADNAAHTAACRIHNITRTTEDLSAVDRTLARTI